MKKLLTTITFSALVGTSVSNLKPIFTNTIVSHGFKSNQINNKDIRITNENDTNPFINKIPTIDDNSNISSNVISSNGTIYLGTYKKGLWKSTDGITFEQVKGLPNDKIRSIETNSNLIIIGFDNGKIYKSVDGIAFNQIYQIDNYIVVNITSDGTIYVGTEKSGLLIIDSLLKINKPNYLGNLYNVIIYNSVQKIDIKEKLVANALLFQQQIFIYLLENTI